MARTARIVVPEYPHHVTQQGVRSLPIFRDDEDRVSYLEFMSRETQRFRVKIFVWCLMTNHVHLIAVPEDESALARAIGEAHKRYSRMRNFAEGVRGYLFQGRFGSCVLDEKHLAAAVRYVENNPVRAGMVKKAWEYSWSSAKFHIGEQEVDVLVKDRDLLGLVGNWREFLEGEDSGREKDLRRATKTARPLVDHEYLTRLEKKTGRNLQKRKPGRKPLDFRK
jgi:putative transposase